MVARLNRNSPIPEVPRPRVSDSEVQRAFDAVATPLAEIQRVTQQFVQPDPVKVLPYSGTWAHSRASEPVPSFWRELNDLVVRGNVVAGAAPTTTIAVLPVGYRPARTTTVVVACYTGARQVMTLDLQPNGRIVYIAGPALVAGVEVQMNFRVSLRP